MVASVTDTIERPAAAAASATRGLDHPRPQRAGVLFLDAVGKRARPEDVVKGTTSLGLPESVILPLGTIQVALLVPYLVPRTAPRRSPVDRGLGARSPRTCGSSIRSSITSSSRSMSRSFPGAGSG